MVTVTSPFEEAVKEQDKVWRPTAKQERFLAVPFDVDEAGYGGALMAGKDLSLDTLIFSTKGFVPLRDIHRGDVILNENGDRILVIAESEVFTNHKCYEIVFMSGECVEKVIVGEDHLWPVYTKDKLAIVYELIPTKQLTTNHFIKFRKFDKYSQQFDIISIEEVKSVKTKCIQVEGGLFVIGKLLVPTHNSDVLMLMPLIYGFHENSKFKGLFLRRTFPELEQEIIPRSQEFYPSSGAVYNIAKHRWEWPNGAMDIFGHLKDEKDVKKYDTGQFPLIRWDEATSFTGYQYEYITIRRNRAPVGSGLPSFTRWGSNPGNVGHTYFRRRFIDPCRQGMKIIYDQKTGNRRIFVPATAMDNPYAREENPKYFKRLQEISSEAERRAMILGDWYTFEGQVFDFRLEPLPGEPDNARHVIEPFYIPDWWPKTISIDWGFAAWCFVIWWAISPAGRVYIYRTYAVKKTKISVWTQDIIRLTGTEVPNVRDVSICWSAVQDIGHEQTLYQQVAEALEDGGFKCGLTKGEKNRISGKQLVHEYLAWEPPAKNELLKRTIGDFDQELARKIERMQGPDALKSYLKFFEPEEDLSRNLPKLQIFSHSPEGRENAELIECIPSCVYDDVKKEDVKEFDGDDPYDCLRIGLYSIRDYFATANSEFEQVKRMGMASDRLSQTNDQTAFYRMCEFNEANNIQVTSVRKQSSRFNRMSRLSSASRAARH